MASLALLLTPCLVSPPTVLVIGGGPAGHFAAIRAATATAAGDDEADALALPSAQRPRVVLLEASETLLAKVRVSGGGRCNVCHDELKDTRELAAMYPRGDRLQLGALTRFGAREAADWFRGWGVTLKTEADGRMFPTTDNSQTIVDALCDASHDAGVAVHRRCKCVDVAPVDAAVEGGGDRYVVTYREGRGAETKVSCRSVVFATGGSKEGHALISRLGVPIVAPVPSLFTLRVASGGVTSGLAGVSVPSACIRLTPQAQGDGGEDRGTAATSEAPSGGARRRRRSPESFEADGPLLVTHRGVSGPAILRLSAFAARALASSSYSGNLCINWAGRLSLEEARRACESMRARAPRRAIVNAPPLALPKRLWSAVATEALQRAPGGSGDSAEQPAPLSWAQLNKAQARELASGLTATLLQITGKDTNKDEFVTAGGVDLKAVDPRSYECRLLEGIFFAGEVLDVDGVTGGHNFQNAWTSGWLAGSAAARDAAAQLRDTMVVAVEDKYE